MAGPVDQVGALGPCPRCDTEVMLKTTIPILHVSGVGLEHVCQACARALVVVGGGGPDRPPLQSVEENLS